MIIAGYLKERPDDPDAIGTLCPPHVHDGRVQPVQHGSLEHMVICRQAQARASVRMRSVRAYVMPCHTITLQRKYSSLEMYI